MNSPHVDPKQDYILSEEGYEVFPEYRGCTIRFSEMDAAFPQREFCFYNVYKDGVLFDINVCLHYSRLQPVKPELVDLIVLVPIGDGYTFSCTITIPVKYSSVEEFQIELEDAIMLARQAGKGTVVFANRLWVLEDFVSYDGGYYPPEVLSYEEWFQRDFITEGE